MRAATGKTSAARQGTSRVVSLDTPDAMGPERVVTVRKRFAQGNPAVMHNNQRVVPPDEERVDALLQHIAGLDVPSVRYMAGQFIPDFDTTITVADGITARVTDKKEAEGELTSITLTLSSTRRTVGGIRSFLENCFHEYRAMITNKLGSKLYVFDHTAIMDACAPRPARFRGEPAVHPPRIRFTKHPFESARALDNVFFGDMPRLRKRLRHFKENRPWYEERGIPWTFGLLMHGIPGAGKTSTIKAIANYMDRHIVNVKLGEVKTKTQLHGLFFDEHMRVASDEPGMPGQDQTYTIPVARRLYVLEVSLSGRSPEVGHVVPTGPFLGWAALALAVGEDLWGLPEHLVPAPPADRPAEQGRPLDVPPDEGARVPGHPLVKVGVEQGDRARVHRDVLTPDVGPRSTQVHEPAARAPRQRPAGRAPRDGFQILSGRAPAR